MHVLIFPIVVLLAIVVARALFTKEGDRRIPNIIEFDPDELVGIEKAEKRTRNSIGNGMHLRLSY